MGVHRADLPARFPRERGRGPGLIAGVRATRMQLDLTEDQAQIRDTVRELCATRVRAARRGAGTRRATCRTSAVAKLAEQGFLGMAIPEEWGGVGYDARTIAIVLEEIARVSAALAIMIAVHNSVGALPVFRFGTEEQRRRFLPRLVSQGAGRVLALRARRRLGRGRAHGRPRCATATTTCSTAPRTGSPTARRPAST